MRWPPSPPPSPPSGRPVRDVQSAAGSASVAPVHRVATIPQAPGEFPLHRDGFVARGHRVEPPIQPRAKVLPMLPHMPGGSVALLVLTKALPGRHHALADVERGVPGVAPGAHRVV